MPTEPDRTVVAPATAPLIINKGAASHDSAIKSVYIATFAVVVVLVATPVVALIYGSLRTSAPGFPGQWTLENFKSLFTGGIVASFATTLYIALISSAVSVLIGTLLAVIIHRTDFKYKAFVSVALGLSFYFPSFILAMAWLILASPGGLINAGVALVSDNIRIDIYSVAGITFVMALNQIPFVYLLMRGPVSGMDGAYEEAARTAGANSRQVFVRVTLPLLAYSVLSSFILSMVISIEQFAIPALIGLPGQITVLSTQLYTLVSFPPADYGLAAAVGLTMSIVLALAIVAQRNVASKGRLTTVTGKAGRASAISLGPWRWAATVFSFGVVILTFILPAGILVYTSVLKWYVSNPLDGTYTFRNYMYIVNSPTSSRIFWNTLILSGVGAGVGVILGLLNGYFTLREKPKGHRTLDFLVSLPFCVPGLVIALGLLWAYAYSPLPLYGTMVVLVVAYVTCYLPYAVEAISGQLVQIDRSLEEAAWVSGATRLTTIRRILVPLVLPSMQSAYFLLFMVFFREVSVAVLLSTSATQVVSVSIFSFFQEANWGLASAFSIVATAVVFVAMGMVSFITNRYGERRGSKL